MKINFIELFSITLENVILSLAQDTHLKDMSGIDTKDCIVAVMSLIKFVSSNRLDLFLEGL